MRCLPKCTASLESDPEIRKSLLQEAEIRGKHLYHKLEESDPELASRIHPNDLVRIVRGLEYLHDRQTCSWWYKHGKNQNPYDVLYIGIIRSRQIAYKNIELRAKGQFQRG